VKQRTALKELEALTYEIQSQSSAIMRNNHNRHTCILPLEAVLLNNKILLLTSMRSSCKDVSYVLSRVTDYYTRSNIFCYFNIKAQ